MAITAANMEYRLSGGSANADVTKSLGGAMSSTAIASGVLGNLFTSISGALASDRYRCIYVRNGHASQTLKNAKIFVQSGTTSDDTGIAIGLDGTAGDNGTPTAIPDVSTAPAGVTFSSPSKYETGLSLGNLAFGHRFPVWVRYHVNAGAAAINPDICTLRVKGDSPD